MGEVNGHGLAAYRHFSVVTVYESRSGRCFKAYKHQRRPAVASAGIANSVELAAYAHPASRTSADELQPHRPLAKAASNCIAMCSLHGCGLLLRVSPWSAPLASASALLPHALPPPKRLDSCPASQGCASACLCDPFLGRCVPAPLLPPAGAWWLARKSDEQPTYGNPCQTRAATNLRLQRFRLLPVEVFPSSASINKHRSTSLAVHVSASPAWVGLWGRGGSR